MSFDSLFSVQEVYSDLVSEYSTFVAQINTQLLLLWLADTFTNNSKDNMCTLNSRLVRFYRRQVDGAKMLLIWY